MATQVIMPQLGESVVEGTVGHWLAAEGQPVKQYDPLVQIITDKVDTEITAPAGGVLLKIYVPEGETVDHGTVLALIGLPGEVAPDAQPAPVIGHGAPEQEAGAAGIAAQGGEAPFSPPVQGEPVAPVAVPVVTPVAQRIALEHGIDLTAVRGSGPGGRILKEDVEAYLAAHPSEAGTPQESASARAPESTLVHQPEQASAAAPDGEADVRQVGFISPVVARLAQEHGVDLTRVSGTGEGGRITKKDVQAFVATQAAAHRPQSGAIAELPPWEQPGTGSLFKPTDEIEAPPMPPSAASAPADQRAAPVSGPASPGQAATGDDELHPLSAMRRSIAQHMVLSKHTSAHVTTVMEADVTPIVQVREGLRAEYDRRGVKLTFTPFFLQAIVAGLQAVPSANSSFREDSLLIHRRMHIGVAVAVADGLIVPVIRDADEKNLLGLARAVNDLAERARARRLSPDDVQGGTFTLTNHGTAGSLFATPVINQPQAGILGVGAIQKRPVVISRSLSLLPGPDDTIAIRPMVYLSFTFDHRILDGAGADNFLAAVKQFLENYPSLHK